MRKKKICLALALVLLFSVLGHGDVVRAEWKCSIEYQVGLEEPRCDTGVTCGNYPPQVVITGKAFFRQRKVYKKTCVNNQGEVQDFFRNDYEVLGCCD